MEKVKLATIVDAMENTNDETHAWLNSVTREISYECDELADDAEQWIAIPEGDDVDEYGIMQDFIDTLPFSQLAQAQELDDAIQGKGAFRKFKDKVIKLGIDEAWYTFQYAAFTEIAQEWAAEFGVAVSE